MQRASWPTMRHCEGAAGWRLKSALAADAALACSTTSRQSCSLFLLALKKVSYTLALNSLIKKMTEQLKHFSIVLVVIIAPASRSEEELPLCPTNVNYLPQTLPMHCRMARSINFPMFPGGLPNFTFPPLPPGYPSPDKLGPTMPFPMPPGLGAPPGLGGAPGVPGPPPMPMQMQMPMMPMAPPGHKVPVIVMPFYSPEAAKKPSSGSKHKGSKKRRIRKNKKKYPSYHSEGDTDTDKGTGETDDSRYGSGDTSSSDGDEGWWGGRRAGRGHRRTHKRRRPGANGEYLTPIIQYITKDGYVIFEKKISKDQANDWLQDKKEFNERDINDPPKEENKWKDEQWKNAQDEDYAAREYVIDNTEAPKWKTVGTKSDDQLDKIKIRVHKNRRKPKSPSENDS